MPLGLDLSGADAKIARARVHAEALYAESIKVVTERNPYGTRMVQIDAKGGWYAIYLTRVEHPREYGLGILFGDAIHNLRCALDYIVVALADASKIKVEKHHQFPIFESRAPYEDKVGDAFVAIPRIKGRKGPLHGITVGLKDIWDLQPFHRKIDPRGDLLAIVHRFSNADKHRVITIDLPFFRQSEFRVIPAGVVEQINLPGPPDWGLNVEHEIALVRFGSPLPHPSQVELQGHITVEVHFATPAVGKEPRGLVIPLGYLGATIDYVTKVVERFKTL